MVSNMNLQEYIKLLEAQDYEGMFNSLFDYIDQNQSFDQYKKETVKDKIKTNIRWTRSKLRKNDRIVWFLRLLRYAWALNLGIPPEQALQDLNRRAKTNYTRYDLMAYDSPTRIQQQLAARLEHFFSMQIPEIDRYVFDKQTPNQVIDHFQKIENQEQSSIGDDADAKEWAKDEQLIEQHSDDDVIMKFPDGYCWVDLNTPADDDEGKAMGHCGNRASYKSDETILSLRKSVNYQGKKWWRPVCTFILDGNRFLGEMKGRSNDKPAARYHPYIIALLKSKYVEGIKGGGYMPRNNFSLNDLDDSQLNELIEMKPELGGLLPLYRKEGMTSRVEDMIDRSLESLNISTYGVRYDKSKKQFKVASWRDFESFIRSHDDGVVQDILEIAQGEAEWQLGSNTAQAFKETVLKLPERWQTKFMQRAAQDDIDDACKVLISRNDDWYQIFQEQRQNDSEIRDQAWERLLEYVEIGWPTSSNADLNIPYKDVESLRAFVTGDSEVIATISERKMVDIATDDYDDDYYIAQKISEYDWDGFDNYDAEWYTEQRQQDDLIDGDGNDTWLADLDTDIDSVFIKPYLERLQGYSMSKIQDPRQGELLEAIKRLRQLAGVVVETIQPEQIDTICAMADLAQAKTAALNLIFANVTNNPTRRADLRDKVMSSGTTDQLRQILWNVLMSNAGFKTGINTTKGRKGITYGR